MRRRDGSTRQDWARRAAARAAQRDGYMAGLLAEYQEDMRMTEQELAGELGCPPERLPLLGLCHEPRRAPSQFAPDVRELAAFAQADPGRLAQLIRHVDHRRATAGATSDRAGGYVAAARDADEPQAPTDHPEDRSATGEPDGSLD